MSPSEPMPSASFTVKAVSFWLVLFALAFANGALREVALRPLLGAVALPLSGLTGAVLLGLAIVAFVRRTRPTATTAAAVGLLWVAMTLAAEVALVAASGKPLGTVGRAFTPAAWAEGDLFAALVLVVGLAPVVTAARLARPPASSRRAGSPVP